ncbi:O-methyltransferase [Rhabdobacter roseus]|uniref:Putative O-methyltransferase YrrM n=1 Tax=Rhabdobacter roseus TaxID=1655419 RepID=A0A840TWK1_9BACT|nr:class I SAM-dependent methyltransferase [Rhabdobacter roseus]MBB5285967.1 putative O-methyltransferase YrrM [Rhabdobacter roseus]
MEFLPKDIETYTEAHTEAESELLRALARETHAKVLRPRMLSGHLQGRFLALLSRLLRPRRILEIGTYTGYSALCLCEGLATDGTLTTLDVNEELESLTRRYFEQSGYASRIDYRLGPAAAIIPQLDETFDLVFIDADKLNYLTYYQLLIDKVRPGGLILADNVLWSGKVVPVPGQRIDKDTQALLDFNRTVHEDPRVSNLLLPIRDGLMILQKNS